MQKVESPFKSGTGLMGATEPGQEVTKENVHHLPPGSVVQLNNGGRLIHLHDKIWLLCDGCAHCYDRIEHLSRKLPGMLCHIPHPSRESHRIAVATNKLIGFAKSGKKRFEDEGVGQEWADELFTKATDLEKLIDSEMGGMEMGSGK